MIAEISCGEYFWSPRVTVTSWPIFRLIDRIVRSGASTYWLRAALPTSRCPCAIQTDDRRQDRVAVLFEDDGPAIADDRDLAVGRSQVDADDRFGVHVVIPRSVRVEPGRSSNPRDPRSSWPSRRRFPSGSVSGCASSSSGQRPAHSQAAAHRLNFREADHAAPPGITSPQLLDHGPGPISRFVDDFDHGHQLGIDRLRPRRGCARPARTAIARRNRF